MSQGPIFQAGCRYSVYGRAGGRVANVGDLTMLFTLNVVTVDFMLSYFAVYSCD